MKHNDILAAMISPLCSWYQKNKRTLPWRENRDPYRVWVSEIMLQQTRVEAALPYYQRFLEALPTVEALANAPMDLLLKLWEGLGYYSRVKNMQKAAQTVMETYGGVFPADRKLLSGLSGIGEYTAGAVASIAFNLPEPAVDGNVLRVIARLLDDDTDIMLPAFKRQIQSELAKVYPMAADCGDLTQAIMELGALVCIPGGVPKCDICPLSHLCRAKKNGREQLLPVRNVKKEKKLTRRTVLVMEHEGKLALVRRPETGVLAGMWEFPCVDKALTEKEVKALAKEWGGAEKTSLLSTHRHIFTHLIWDMQAYFAEALEENDRFSWMTMEELSETIALPSAMQPFFQAFLEKKK